MSTRLSNADKGPRWTASYLAFVLPLTVEEVLRPQSDSMHGASPKSRIEWRWIDYAQRLVWSYGFDEALRRLGGSPEPEARAA